MNQHLMIVKPKYYDQIAVARTKTVEFRAYTSRRAPWGRIFKGDKVWIKPTGRDVSAKAIIDFVVSLEDPDIEQLKVALLHWRASMGENWPVGNARRLATQIYLEKRHVMFIGLKDVFELSDPIRVRRSYGSAWETISSIEEMRL